MTGLLGEIEKEVVTASNYKELEFLPKARCCPDPKGWLEALLVAYGWQRIPIAKSLPFYKGVGGAHAEKRLCVHCVCVSRLAQGCKFYLKVT